MTATQSNWTAIETTDFAGGNRKLVVAGEVEVNQSNAERDLIEASPQGLVPTELILELKVKSQGTGAQVMTMKLVTYEKAVSRHQYSDVLITGMPSGNIYIKVEEIIS